MHSDGYELYVRVSAGWVSNKCSFVRERAMMEDQILITVFYYMYYRHTLYGLITIYPLYSTVFIL